ncbi:hypothetical protein SKAU_G00143280 [Synaphobranchus kaupii]|uniref:Uncharacterized protein n=1 Tax=Synaphobranchus kaupii TaxID=118154 RepID=A0A9Q1FSR9_SYNKA|nr:hypothetical protein SKAU_G00143280 [Synaphobranchus kaupii]
MIPVSTPPRADQLQRLGQAALLGPALTHPVGKGRGQTLTAYSTESVRRGHCHGNCCGNVQGRVSGTGANFATAEDTKPVLHEWRLVY